MFVLSVPSRSEIDLIEKLRCQGTHELPPEIKCVHMSWTCTLSIWMCPRIWWTVDSSTLCVHVAFSLLPPRCVAPFLASIIKIMKNPLNAYCAIVFQFAQWATPYVSRTTCHWFCKGHSYTSVHTLFPRTTTWSHEGVHQILLTLPNYVKRLKLHNMALWLRGILRNCINIVTLSVNCTKRCGKLRS